MSEPAAKKQRFERRVVRRNALQEELEALYANQDASFLWDTTKTWWFIRPSTNIAYNMDKRYVYIGRERAKELYGTIMSRQAGQHMQLLGAKGTGKRTAVCTIAGFLQGSKKRRVVYIYAKRFIDSPFPVFRDALLLACPGNSCGDLGSRTTLEDLEDWCDEQPDGSLLFVVDDWDRFEVEGKEELGDVIKTAASFQVLVKLSSVNSRERKIWLASDKADEDIETFFFDGPFNSSEMKTWIGQSGLSDAQLLHVDRLTGGMPRLLSFYEQVKGSETTFSQKIRDPYTHKLFNEFIGLLKTREELLAARNLVIYGELSHHLKDVKMTCFYKDDNERYRLLSPYLRSQAEYYIMEQNSMLNSLLRYSDMATWAAAVRLDISSQGSTNPARVGWNVEGLVISTMRYRKKVFNFDFKHYRTYEHGGEKEALERLSWAELRAAVLLGPVAFNEKAVDVIYIKLEGDVLLIKALQITVAQWKAKQKKQSHKVWEKEVLPRWDPKRPKWKSKEQEFYYVMPEQVVLEDVRKTEFRKFADVDDSLEEFDALLLPEPNKCKKVIPTQCSGKTIGGHPCGNRAYVPQGPYYCHYHRA